MKLLPVFESKYKKQIDNITDGEISKYGDSTEFLNDFVQKLISMDNSLDRNTVKREIQDDIENRFAQYFENSISKRRRNDIELVSINEL